MSALGFCQDCGVEHRIGEGNAKTIARELMANFEKHQRLDFHLPESEADPALHFDKIFAGNRGHMFGVLECVDADGQTQVLKAYSSLHGGLRNIDGWSPHLVAESDYEQVILPGQKIIKQLTAEMNALPEHDMRRDKIFAQRKAFSQNLMAEIHNMYQFTNFQGETRRLHDAFLHKKIPGGAGDCCAPKLIQQAVHLGLTPIGIAEFFWGGSNASGRKQPGQFFEACKEKCQPLLGFLLCGLEG
ncbi:MAG: hypothetical protein AAF226_04150 [Verrucomicrobiota bacterium]